MLRKCVYLPWRYRKLTLCAVVAAFLFLLNVVAFKHAHAMTHFREGGAPTGNPEALSRFQTVKVLLMGVQVPRPVNEADPKSQGLTFQTCQFHGTDGITLEGWHVPHPQAKGIVLLVHGYARCKANLLPEARAFHDLGFAAVLLDLRGSGGSDGSETTIGFFESEDVAAAARTLQADYPDQPLILYGRSMGSVAILRAIALNQVQPAAAIVECPFDRLLTTVEHRFSTMGLPAFPSAHLMVFWGGVQHGFNGFRHNPVEYARAIQCPVLLMHGETDPKVTAAEARTIFDELAGEKEFELFPGVGHQSYLGADRARWQRRVSGFLEKHAP